MKIPLPSPIYEENIVSFSQADGNCYLIYTDENNPDCRYELRFTGVYYSDFTDFELMPAAICDWHFGLETVEPEESDLLQGRLKDKLTLLIGFPHYKHLRALKHYRLIVDDVGWYNIISKDFNVIQTGIGNTSGDRFSETL